jgi:hypothetical protein
LHCSLAELANSQSSLQDAGKKCPYLGSNGAFHSMALVLIRIHSRRVRKSTYHHILVLFNELSTANALEVTIHAAAQNNGFLKAGFGISVRVNTRNFFSTTNRPMNSVDSVVGLTIVAIFLPVAIVCRYERL